MRSDPGDDDTVRLAPRVRQAARNGPRRVWLAATAGAVVLALFAAWRFWPHPVPHPVPLPRPAVAVAHPPPLAPAPAPTAAQPPAPSEFHVQTATEQQIRDDVSSALTIFRFAADPRIVVLDFASLQEQGLMLDRVAALMEKATTPRERVLTDAALDQAIESDGDTIATYYYGHDYSAAELVRFFKLADAEHVALYPEEETLRRLLIQLGWFLPGAEGALISLPRTGADPRVTYAARGTILHHELSHGAYFSDPTYAAYVHQFWEHALTHDEREAVRQFLASEEYDPNLADLMQNEMQAYLMFTRDPAFFAPADIAMTPARLAALQEEFQQNLPLPWLREMMNAAVPVSAAR
jgi:hypothetical protein